MNSTLATLAALALALAARPAMAQQASAAHCPLLPPGAGLSWEAQVMGDSDFCRALRSDGSEAFGMYITPEPSFEPNERNAEEASRVDGRNVTWYRAEIATAPGIEARETLLPLADGRNAHIWLQAGSTAELATGYKTLSQLRFGRSPQVAGN